MNKSLTTPQVIKALEEFRKKHPGRLRLRIQLRVTWVEDITKFELRDKVWKEPSITTKSGAIYKFSEAYTGIFMEDFYEEPCSVLGYDRDHPDELRYYFNIPIHIDRELGKGDAMVAYLPEMKPYHCTMSPHHSLIINEKDMEKIYSAKRTHDILTGFSQGIRFIANRFIYPDGVISKNDPDDLSGYVTTLIIL